jgi:hypothetical protein
VELVQRYVLFFELLVHVLALLLEYLELGPERERCPLEHNIMVGQLAP